MLPLPYVRPWIIVAAAVFAFLAVGGLAVWKHKTDPYHFRSVTHGVLYRSGWLTPENFEMIVDRYGIKTVLNVSEEREKRKPDWWHEDEIRICKEKGIELIEMPIMSGVPPNAEEVARWLALLEDEKALPVLLHCDHGVMRTGMLVAVYEMEKLGKSNEQALADMPMFGHNLKGERKAPIRNFVLEYEPRGK